MEEGFNILISFSFGSSTNTARRVRCIFNPLPFDCDIVNGTNITRNALTAKGVGAARRTDPRLSWAYAMHIAKTHILIEGSGLKQGRVAGGSNERVFEKEGEDNLRFDDKTNFYVFFIFAFLCVIQIQTHLICLKNEWLWARNGIYLFIYLPSWLPWLLPLYLHDAMMFRIQSRAEPQRNQQWYCVPSYPSLYTEKENKHYQPGIQMETVKLEIHAHTQREKGDIKRGIT